MKRWWAFFFSALCVLALMLSDVVVGVSKQTLAMFFEVLIPSLFFMMVVLKTMELSGLLGFIGLGCHRLFSWLLRSRKEEMPYVVSGLLLGFAGNAMLVNDAVSRDWLSLTSARRILFHLHMPTITFCVVTCGSLLGDVRYGVLLYAMQMLVALVGYRLSCHQDREFPFVGNFMDHETNKKPMLPCLSKALVFTGLGLFQMAGYILLASVVLAFALPLLPTGLHLPLQAIMEFASSSVMVSQLGLPLLHRWMILAVIFGFGGFCGHLQVYTSLSCVRLPYHSYFAMRVMQAMVSASLTGLIGYIWL